MAFDRAQRPIDSRTSGLPDAATCIPFSQWRVASLNAESKLIDSSNRYWEETLSTSKASASALYQNLSLQRLKGGYKDMSGYFQGYGQWDFGWLRRTAVHGPAIAKQSGK